MKYFLTLFLSFYSLFAQDSTTAVSKEAWMKNAKDMVGDSTVSVSKSDAFQDTPTTTKSHLDSKETKIFGDLTIAADETYDNNVRVIGGNLTVDGVLNGDATVIGGNVFIHDNAVVDGDILALGGKVQKSNKAVINGKIIETNLTEGLVYRETGSPGDSSGHWNWDWSDDRDHEGCGDENSHYSWVHPKTTWFVYNRNEGYVFTPINTVWDRDGESTFSLSLSLGYRQADHSLVGGMDFQKSFFQNKNLILFAGLSNHSRTDDYYRISQSENTVSGLLGRQDFMDRWNEEGWHAGLGLAFWGIRSSFSINSVNRDTLGVVNLWSLFNHDRALRSDLTFNSYNANYFSITADAKTSEYSLLHTGLAAHINAELFGDNLSTQDLLASNLQDLNARIFVSTTTNLEFTRGILLRGRILLGTAQGSLPAFRYFGVGGLGSVGAHDFKEQQGDEMIEGSLALIFTPEFLDMDMFISPFYSAGHAWMDMYQPYSITDFSAYSGNMIHAAGVSIGSVDQDDVDVVFNIAKSMDVPSRYQTTIRFTLYF